MTGRAMGDRNGSGSLEFYCYKVKSRQLLFSVGPADDPSDRQFLPGAEVLRSPMRERFSAADLALMDERFAALGSSNASNAYAPVARP